MSHVRVWVCVWVHSEYWFTRVPQNVPKMMRARDWVCVSACFAPVCVCSSFLSLLPFYAFIWLYLIYINAINISRFLWWRARGNALYVDYIWYFCENKLCKEYSSVCVRLRFSCCAVLNCTLANRYIVNEWECLPWFWLLVRASPSDATWVPSSALYSLPPKTTN